MSELSKGIDVSFLIGRKLQQLALGLYEFQFGFDGEISISIQQLIFVETSGKDLTEIRADNPEQTKNLYFLLGRVVQDAQILEEKTLKLVFDDQSKITITPSVTGYESYVIWNKGKCCAI